MKVILRNSEGCNISTINEPTKAMTIEIMIRDWLSQLCEGDTIVVIREYDDDGHNFEGSRY